MKKIRKRVHFISFPSLCLLLLLFAMGTCVYAADNEADSLPIPEESVTASSEGIIGSQPGDVPEIESGIADNMTLLEWDNEAVDYAYAIITFTYGIPGSGDEKTEVIEIDDPYDKYHWFYDLVEQNRDCQFNYTVELYDDADQLVGIGSGGPITFHKLDIIPEVIDSEGNLDEFNDDYKGTFYYGENYDFDYDLITQPESYFMTDFNGRVESIDGFSGYQYIETEINGTIHTERIIDFSCDCDTTIVIRFRQSEERIPFHFNIGNPTSDYPNLANTLVDILNDKDELCDAVLESDGKTITLQILKAQNRNNVLMYIRDALMDYDFSLAYSTSILLSFKESYPSFDAYNADHLSYNLTQRSLAENTTLYMVWCEKIDTITLTIDPPVAGTHVTCETVDNEDGTSSVIQTNGPHFIQDEESAGKVDLDAYWGTDMVSTYYFMGTIEEDAECPVVIDLSPHFGYIVNKGTIIIVNGKMITPASIFGFYYAQTSLKSVAALPSFTTHSLTLDGLIGVNFFMNLPELPGVDYEESYMEFTISGKGGIVTKDAYDAGDTSREGGYFGFTRYVSSVQMADTITATFHYGDGFTVTDTYSVADYVKDFENEKDNYGETTADLVYALADYGHFVQPMLARTRGWELGKDHAVMPGHTDSFDDEIALAADEVSGNAAKCPLAGSGISKIRMCLLLDSSTTLVLRITPEGASSGEISYTIDDGASGSAKTLSDGRFEIKLPDISAVELGKAHSIKLQASGNTSLVISPLAYIDTVMHDSSYQDDTDMLSAMTALYRYYKAASAF